MEGNIVKLEKILNAIGVTYMLFGFIVGIIPVLTMGSNGIWYSIAIIFGSFSQGMIFLALSDVLTNQQVLFEKVTILKNDKEI